MDAVKDSTCCESESKEPKAEDYSSAPILNENRVACC